MYCKAVTDHLGNKYRSIKEMCEEYNIPYRTFMKRMNQYGWDLKAALTIHKYIKEYQK